MEDGTFEIEWHASDGYVSGGRPQYAVVDLEDIEDGMSDEQLERVFDGAVQDDFEAKVEADVKTEIGEFLDWAHEVQAKKREEVRDAT